MANRSVADFVDHIVPYTPDVPDTLLQDVTRQSIVQFMRETRLFLEEVALKGQEGVTDYIIPLESCHKIVQIENVWVSDTPDPMIDTYSSRLPTGVMDIPAAGDVYPTKMSWRHDEMNRSKDTFILNFDVKEGHYVIVRYSWAIGRDECDFPEVIYEEYLEAIRDLTLHKLYSMGDQEWADKGEATKMLRYYETLKRRARTSKYKNHGPQAMQMRGRRWLR